MRDRLMAALRVQSLATVGSLTHGPSLVSKKGVSVKSVTFVTKKNRSFKSVRCGSSESDENVDISEIVLNSSNDDLFAMSKAEKRTSSESSPARVPKFTTLRPFGEAGAGVMTGLEGSLFELLAANIEATADLKRFETLSGRLAMMAFFVAIGVEITTGNSVFKGIDVKELGQFAAFAGVATVTAAGFAFAWRSRSDVASSLSKGALKLLDTAVDNVIDGLFYDDEEKFNE